MPPSPKLFKSYIVQSADYLGGKSASEIKTTADKIYKLSSNENPIGASPKAIEAIKNKANQLHIYPDRTDQRLRQALTTFYQNQIPEYQFFSANSGSDCLQLIIQSFLSKDQECIISNPAFGVYRKFAGWVGAKVVDIPLTKPNFTLDINGIVSAINDHTRIIFLTSPNNPTGTYIPKSTLDQLLPQIPKHVVVVFDEVYWNFADAPDFTTAMDYVKQGHQIIGINSFSKTYGLAGMRLGYGYSTPEIASYLQAASRPFLVNSLAIEAGIAALSDSSYLNQVVSTVQNGRTFLYHALDNLQVKYWPSQGNFILIKPDGDSQKMVADLITHGIMTREVTNFGAPGCIRVTIGTEEANTAFINAVKKILES